jgi:glycosyltransferase involved in cell wall biosynthesis
LLLRSRLSRFAVLQLVGGSHAPSLLPILARRPFVSWVATPFGDEIEGRYVPGCSASVRVNHHLRHLNEAIERWTYTRAQRVFVLSRYTARRLAELGGGPIERFEVLRVPVDLGHFTPDGPAWPKAPREYLLSVGRVDDERKNIESLVRCFAKLATERPELHLVIAGDVDPNGRVARLARGLGLGDRVLFPGSLEGEELAAAYRGAAAFVMTSRQEGLGIVVLEAQASGLACVVMRCGGSEELVEEGKTGFTVAQGNEEAFVARLRELLSRPDARARIGGSAREALEQAHLAETFERTVAGAYRDVFAVPDASGRRASAQFFAKRSLASIS